MTESRERREPQVIVIANQKGGVGKTTTAVNVATALAAVGERVNIIDLDPQGNASTGLGIAEEDRVCSSYDLLSGRIPMSAAVMETFVPNLTLVCSTLDLLGIEGELGKEADRVYRLRKALQEFMEAEACMLSWGQRHRYFIVDCPPSLNLLTMNALAAADSVIIPLQCEFLALEGLGQILRVIEKIRKGVNPNLRLHGIVLTMYDSRNRLSERVVQDVRSVMGDKVYRTIIPRNVRISEAPSYGKPVLLYDHRCPGAVAYLQLASEIIDRERLGHAA